MLLKNHRTIIYQGPEDLVGVQLRVADRVGALHQDAPGGDRLALLQHRAVGRVVGPLPQLALQGIAETDMSTACQRSSKLSPSKLSYKIQCMYVAMLRT